MGVTMEMIAYTTPLRATDTIATWFQWSAPSARRRPNISTRCWACQSGYTMGSSSAASHTAKPAHSPAYRPLRLPDGQNRVPIRPGTNCSAATNDNTPSSTAE
jgi:hypothetical protein